MTTLNRRAPRCTEPIHVELARLLGGQLLPAERGRDAIVRALDDGGIGTGDHVCVTTTSGSSCVSPCVQWALGRWHWGRQTMPATRAVVVIHEWGIPHPGLPAIARTCRQRGWLLIEDCAHALGTALWSGAVGHHGDYAIYSLPKFVPLTQGGLLRLPGQGAVTALPPEWEAPLARLAARRREDGTLRRSAWHELSVAVASRGAVPVLPLPDDAVPWMLPLRHRRIHHLTRALNARGIGAEACVHIGATLIPCAGRGPSGDELVALLAETENTPPVTSLYPRSEHKGAW